MRKTGKVKVIIKMANNMNNEEMKTEPEGLEKRTGTW